MAEWFKAYAWKAYEVFASAGSNPVLYANTIYSIMSGMHNTIYILKVIMKREMRFMSHDEFLKHIDKLHNNLSKFLDENQIKVDYLVPVLRSGAVPAVYLANRLNIVKFAPIQIKHITYKDKSENIEVIFNPLSNLNIDKKDPVFLIVEGTHSSGTSVKLCIKEILKVYPQARLLYVCIAKNYNSISFTDKTIYEDYAFLKGNNLSKEECEKLGIEFLDAVYPWETLEGEQTHPDDLEENIFF